MIDYEEGIAWDCNPEMQIIEEAYDLDLNEEDSTGDWQVIVLDRFGDRMVTEGLFDRDCLDDEWQNEETYDLTLEPI